MTQPAKVALRETVIKKIDYIAMPARGLQIHTIPEVHTAPALAIAGTEFAIAMKSQAAVPWTKTTVFFDPNLWFLAD